MRALTLTLIFAVFGLATGVAQKPEPVVWTDSTRDVFVNGEIDRSAQVLTSEATHRIALISARLEHAAVLDTSRHTLNTCSPDSFRFYPDHVIALSDPDFGVSLAGSYKLHGDSDYSFELGGRAVHIAIHQPLIGETDTQRLFEIVPVWRFAMDSSQPDFGVIARLKHCQAETTITVALGTWCPDSKKHVPRLLKALELTANSRFHIKLIGIGRKLHEPRDIIKHFKLIHVPTVIVERAGLEIGRIIERPTTTTMEEDLAAILIGFSKHSEHK
jgi:hypothetical protein